MTEDLAPIGEYIDIIPEAPEPATRGPAPDPEKARYVIGLLTAAGLKSEFGFDVGQAEELWGVRLAAFDLDLLEAGSADWISQDTHVFPSLGEFVSTCLRLKNRANAIQAAHDHPIPGQVCIECEGDTWVEVGDQGVIATVRPCSVCRPEQFKLHKDGHYSAHHQTLGGCQECVGSKR